MKSLAAAWKQQARRVDALSLRERAIMFGLGALALVALADGFVVSPRMAEQKALTAQMRQQAGELVQIRKVLEGGQADTPTAKLAAELKQAAADQRVLEEEITRRVAAGDSGVRLPELLERVLRRHERLTLLGLATSAPVAGGLAKLPRQTVDLSLRGSYADLLEYVAATEAALPGLRWGALTITSNGAGLSDLSAQVILVGALI